MINLETTVAPALRFKWAVPLLSLVGGGVLLGLSTNLAKTASEMSLSPLAFLFWSVVGAAAILLSLAAGRRELPPINARSLEYYLVSALLGVAGSNLLFFSAVPHVGAGFVALLICLPPLLTYAGALSLKMERFQWLRAAGVVVALAGAAVLAAGKFSTVGSDRWWIVPVLVGTGMLAAGNLYRTLRWPVGASASALAPGMLVAAAILLAAAASFPGLSLRVPLNQAPVLILIATHSLVFAAMFQLLFVLQKTGGPVLLSLLGSVGALTAVPVAIFLQGEAPPHGLLPGALLIGTGVALLTFGKVLR
ncbi:DMT family transporter [Halopseudomonas sp.]|uniref:DMT family transporter n=1 Tax=Halopseudomonas sp. TaxID=2901191 RepID=UPI00311F8562